MLVLIKKTLLLIEACRVYKVLDKCDPFFELMAMKLCVPLIITGKGQMLLQLSGAGMMQQHNS